MFEFLFDIKPDAGNVCPTTRLAYLISERGNKVYYTCLLYTSDAADEL